MRHSISIVSGIAAIMTLAAAAVAVEPAPQRAPALARLAACRAVTDQTQRLACYDAAAAVLDEDEAKGALVVVDRDQMRSTRRTLFGLKLPRLALFGRSDRANAEDEVKRVDTTIASFSGQPGRVLFTTAEGATWQQIDDFPIVGKVQPGTKVTVYRNVIGTFFARVGSRPGFKVERLNR